MTSLTQFSFHFFFHSLLTYVACWLASSGSSSGDDSISHEYPLIPHDTCVQNVSARYLHVDTVRRRHFICAAATAIHALHPSEVHLLNVHTHTQYQHPKKKKYYSFLYTMDVTSHIPGAIFAHYDEYNSTKKKKQIKKNPKRN